MTETTDTQPAPPAKKKRRWIKVLFYVLLLVAVALAGLFLFGPREPVNTAIRFDATTIGDDIDTYLAQSEAQFDDIEPGLQKEVVWAYPASKAKTPVSLVYIHGFSASRGETDPLTALAAADLDANVFYTRLSGHGRGGDAMAEPTVQDWMDDAAEAIAIGKRIGEKTILVTTSTGGTIAAIAAFDPALRTQIDGIVFIAPNFKLATGAAPVLTMPFARQIVPMIVGAERGFEPENELHAKFWTERYPSTALLPMAAAVKQANGLLYERVDIPALFIFADGDRVVNHTRTRQIHSRWGGNKALITVEDSTDPYNHVIAGDALSPNTTERLAGDIAGWVERL
ncbi:MAG: alpha/beta fold hydrolase [Ahrensia sp.]